MFQIQTRNLNLGQNLFSPYSLLGLFNILLANEQKLCNTTNHTVMPTNIYRKFPRTVSAAIVS